MEISGLAFINIFCERVNKKARDLFKMEVNVLNAIAENEAKR